MMDIIIRNETPADYRAVEELTRESFWNVYKPGADEHYYVHQMRSHPDFIPELAFVLEKDGEIMVSCSGTIKHKGKFYDYQTKYEDKRTEYIIPSRIGEKAEKYARECAKMMFLQLTMLLKQLNQ